MDNTPRTCALICVPAQDELPEPPLSGEETGLVCPGCLGMNGATTKVENAVVARCPDCQCEWPMHEHQHAHLVIDLLLEQRQRARHELANL